MATARAAAHVRLLPHEVPEKAYHSLACLSRMHRKIYLSPSTLVEVLCSPSHLHRGCDRLSACGSFCTANLACITALCLNSIPAGGQCLIALSAKRLSGARRVDPSVTVGLSEGRSKRQRGLPVRTVIDIIMTRILAFCRPERHLALQTLLGANIVDQAILPGM